MLRVLVDETGFPPELLKELVESLEQESGCAPAVERLEGSLSGLSDHAVAQRVTEGVVLATKDVRLHQTMVSTGRRSATVRKGKLWTRLVEGAEPLKLDPAVPAEHRARAAARSEAEALLIGFAYALLGPKADKDARATRHQIGEQLGSLQSVNLIVVRCQLAVHRGSWIAVWQLSCGAGERRWNGHPKFLRLKADSGKTALELLELQVSAQIVALHINRAKRFVMQVKHDERLIGRDVLEATPDLESVTGLRNRVATSGIKGVLQCFRTLMPVVGLVQGPKVIDGREIATRLNKELTRITSRGDKGRELRTVSRDTVKEAIVEKFISMKQGQR